MWRGIVVAALVGSALLLGFASESVAAVAVERGGMLSVLQSVRAAPNISGSDLYAFAGSRAAGFSEPQVISEPGDSIAAPGSGLAEPQLVADSAGNLLAAWNAARLYDAFSDQYPYTEAFSRGVWYAWRPAGLPSFQPPRQLLPPGPVSLIRLVMNDRGEAVAAYREGTSIYIRRFTSGGTFGSPELVAAGSATEDPAVLLGIDLTESGELVAVTETKHLVQARFAAPGRSLGAPQTLTTEAQPFWAGEPPIVLTAPDEPPHTLAESHITVKAFARATLRMRLDRQARSELNSGRGLASTLTISTLGESAPPTTSEYPLTILPPSQRQPRHKRHPKRHLRHRSTWRR
jgi:hypothetical protein